MRVGGLKKKRVEYPKISLALNEDLLNGISWTFTLNNGPATYILPFSIFKNTFQL